MKPKKIAIIIVILLMSVSFINAKELTDREIQQIEYDAGTAYNEGVELYNSKDYHGAIDKFLISLEKYQQIDTEENPKTVRISELYKNLSVLYNMTKQYDKAIEYYSLRLQREPENHRINISLSTLYEKIGKKDKALQILIDFNKNYNQYKIKSKIAQIYEERNDIPNAIKYYSEAFNLNKKKVDILGKVALFYHKIGQDTSAIKIYNDYIATKPEDYILKKVYKNLGIFYQNMGNIDDAILAFEESDSIKFDKEVCLILGQLYYERGNYTTAKLNLAKVKEKEPNNPQAHYYLGLIYRKEGKNAEALAEFEKIKNHHTLGPAAKQQIEFIKKSE
ncbi:MAG: tetratricopeptide repeat protein [Candidatus Cloacimonadota bacterium]|nr:tetratricopeptide repeat protein [Candidatus Cloacimonadota bacterium]